MFCNEPLPPNSSTLCIRDANSQEMTLIAGLTLENVKLREKHMQSINANHQNVLESDAGVDGVHL